MIQNKTKLISLVASTILFSGCSLTNMNTNLNQEDSNPDVVETVEEKKDTLISINEVKSTIDNQKSLLEKHGLKENKDASEKDHKIFSERKKLSSEKLNNYLAFKRDQSEKLSSENVSLNLEDVEIKEAFKLIAKVSKKNIVIGEEVEGTISADLKDISWEQALETLLKIKGLVKYIDADVIRIHKPEVLLKLEQYDRDRIRAFKEEIKLQKDIEPMELEVFKLFYVTPKEIEKQLNDILIKLMDPEETAGAAGAAPAANLKDFKITTDERTRSIIIEAPRNVLEKADAIIKTLDVRTKQVLIEAFIVEANDNFSFELETGLGVSLIDPTSNVNIAGGADSSVAVSSGVNPGFGTFNLIQNVSSTKLNLALNALENKGFSRTLANPKFFTMNNTKGMVMQGSQLAYVTKTMDNVQTIFKDAVLKLEATPNVIGDGNLILDLLVTKDRPEKLDVSAEAGIAKMEIKTQLLLKEGDIAIIGGVYEEGNSKSDQKVPFFGDIPIVGELFKNKLDSSNKKELIIFITAKSI